MFKLLHGLCVQNVLNIPILAVLANRDDLCIYLFIGVCEVY